jgi:starch-binding outer membrane protein, SusD/RagB family
MKKYIIFIVLIFFIGSCSKDFLEEKTVTTLTQDYYKTAEGLDILVKGTYQILRVKPDYSQGHYVYGIGSDVENFCWSLAERIDMGSYSASGWAATTAGTTRLGSMIPMLIGAIGGNVTEGVFPTVSRVNVFLENYAILSVADQTKLAARKGEMLFLRSYAYYTLTNILGDVPLILKSYSGLPENFAFPKASLETIYKQIIGDLRTAVNLLPETVTASDLGRVTKPAAAHLLAKLYLHRAQAAGWANAETHLKMLYKGNVTTDLDSAIFYSTMVIDLKKGNNAAYGGLQTDFAELWKNVAGNYDRDNCKEILLSAQYEPTQVYDARYGNTLVHLYNSNYTTLNCGVVRTLMDYNRPYATAGATDWGFDQYPDRANDSRYYKTYLTDYFANNTAYNATTLQVTGGKAWTAAEAYYYNNVLKSASDAAVTSGAIKILYKKTGLVYIENSKDQPFDSLWVASQPFIMMVRWQVGSPGNAGYFTKSGSTISGFKTGAVDLANPAVITDYKAQNRKIYYRLSGDKGEAFGIDRGLAVSQWYMGPRKWLDVNRGTGTLPNNPGAIDVPLYRLAETYLIRAEAYGRKSNYTSAIADLNVLRKRAAYHANETRSEILVKYEPGVLKGTLDVPAAEKVSPYTVKTDSYSKITIDGTEWQGGSAKAVNENYPAEAASDAQRFIHFIYNERARELIFELTTVEDIHNAGIFFERVRDRDMLGAPSSSHGTSAFPFPVDDTKNTGTVGAQGIGKGQLQKFHNFKPWPQSFLDLLTDDKGVTLDTGAKAAYQNPGY